jgi:NADH-quinone oxidoreductase subunit E
MVPKEILNTLKQKLSETAHPRELAVEVMVTLQKHYGYLSDEALQQGGELLGLTPLELEELATFYEFIYRRPVGKYIIHLCDNTVCWMLGHQSILDYLSGKLGIPLGGTTADGLFTLLPVCCIGYCDHAPAMLINGKLYGPLTPEGIDQILKNLRDGHPNTNRIDYER